MDPADWKARLLPTALVEHALSDARHVFSSRYSEIGFVAVSLEQDTGELVAALSETIEVEQGAPVQPSLPAMSFVTAVVDPRESLGAGSGPPDEFDAKNAIEALSLHPCFLVPLRKRADVDAAFRARISVGRARNMDIVLRHSSVSKFHGWFQIDEAAAPYVTDGGSKNGTRVDGDQLVPRTPKPLEAGSRVHFGRVQAVYLPTGLLYHAGRA